MKNRKLQRVLTWILTLTMILGTFGNTGLALQAADVDDEAEAVVEDADDPVDAEDADVPDPDESFEDTTLLVKAETQNKFGVFTVRADEAKQLDFNSGTTYTATLDSVNGATFFVAPLAGYEIKEADLADAIKVSGAYAENDEKKAAGTNDETKAANWVMIPDSAFTIAKATKTEVDANVNYAHTSNPYWYDEYDFSAAWTVTVDGSSEWINAYKLALYNDKLQGTQQVNSDTTKAADLAITIDDSKVTGKEIPVTVVGAEKPLAKINYDYSATITDPIDFENAVYDWTDKTVEVALLGTNEKGEVVKKTINKVTEFTVNPTQAEYKLATGSGKAYMNRLAVQDAYYWGLQGYALTVTITQNADKAVYVQSATDLATFSTVTADNLTLVATDEAAVWLKQAAATDIDFWVDLADTNAGRTITAVYYQYEDDAERTKLTAQNVNPVVSYTEIVNPAANANPKENGWYVVDNNATSGYALTTDTAVTGGHTYFVKKGTDNNSTWYKLPVTTAKAGKTATLSVDTTETVVYKVSDDGINLTATITDNTWSVAGTPVNGPLCTTATPKDTEVTSWVETGKDYKFQVVAKDDNRIKSVLAKMYAVDGTGGENITLVEDDFGWYTASAVTGKLEITVVTEAEPADVHKVSIAEAGPEVKEIVTGTVITTNPTYMAYGGEDFSFRVVPSANKMVKAVSYTMGNATENKIALTATKALLDGTCYYTIPAVSGNVVIYIEEIDAVRVQKLKNVDATITIGGVELEDEKVALVPAGEDFTFRAVGKNGAEVDTMYFIYEDKASDITEKALAGKSLTGSDDGDYTIAKINLTVHTTENLFLTAYTVRPGDEALVVRTYKGVYTDLADMPKLADRKNLITSDSIYAGGDKATDDREDNQTSIYAHVEKADGTSADLSDKDPTHEWTITDSDRKR